MSHESVGAKSCPFSPEAGERVGARGSPAPVVEAAGGTWGPPRTPGAPLARGPAARPAPWLAALLLALLPAAARAQFDAPPPAVAVAAPGVVALVVSQNPRHLPRPADAPPPLKLGAYPLPGQRPDPKLDLSDPANAADYTLGSGVVLDARQGLVLTTYSLIDGARKVYARTSSGAGCYADIHAADARADLAVLKLIDPPGRLAAVALFQGRTTPGAGGQRPNLPRGLPVVALGHPTPASAASGQATAAFGRVTEVGQRWPGLAAAPESDAKHKPLSHFAVLLRTDAASTFACPGAAVLNGAGELVALTAPASGVSGPDGGGYAIPMDVNYRRIVEVLKKGREVEYGFLGVSLLPQAGRGPGFDGGLAISGVTPGGPAARAELRGGPRGFFGDTITAIDGTPLDDLDDLFLAVGSALAGSEVVLDVADGQGQRRRVTATLAKYPHALPKLSSVGAPTAFGLRADYGSVLTLDQSLGAIPPGVAAEFAPGSAVAKKFAALDAPGAVRAWVVTEVDGTPVGTPADFARLTAGKDSATFTVADAAQPGRTYPLTLP